MAASGVDKILDELGKLSVLDLVELKKKIEDEWGVTAAAPVANKNAPMLQNPQPIQLPQQVCSLCRGA